MRGDYTRFTFDPRKRFTSVLLQQGRVQLDSDWNELAAITAHLEQTETIDVIGVCGAPEAGGGFAIEPIDGNADFRITNGRIYVGGLLCELLPEEMPIADFPTANKIELPAAVLDGRPIAADDWLELAADDEKPRLFRVTNVDASTVTFTKSPKDDFGDPDKNPTVRRALTYKTQPDLPGPLEPDEGRTDLVYLDVWQRHVTAVEDPRIREEALLGPDTATRIQTVCQVRIEPNRKSCDDLDDLVPERSGGRLTTRARPGSDAENLCIVPPGGGYNALENRLYRVEIHDGGDIGKATYKWSRYNGAVAYPVARFDDTVTDRIWLRGLGDDDVLRLKRGDWVEVMDDETELAGEVGTLVCVDGIDEGERSVKIIPAIDKGTFTVARHARVRRWDEDVPTDGSVETATGWNGLENGVEIRFTGEEFKPGDYWAFAARTNTGQVGRPGALLPDQLVVGVEDGLGRPVEGYEVIFEVEEGDGTLEPGPMSPLNLETNPQGLAACRLKLGPDPDVRSEVRVKLATTPSPQAKSLPVVFHATSYYLSLRYLSGDGQHGRAGAILPAPLIVGVEDAGGRPVRRAELTFTAEGGGSVGEVGTDPTSDTFTIRTDSTGVARAAWKLGQDPDDEHRVVAALTGLGPPASVGQDAALGITFAATAHYLSLRYIGGDGQAGRAGGVLPSPLVVGVEDSDGRPVPGVSVVFDADGGGELTDMAASTSAPSLTDETGNDGTVGVVWKLGEDPDDAQEVVASLEGIGTAAGAQDAALEVVFRARPQYLSLRYITGDGREGRPGEILSDPPLAVGVEDGDGRPVPDVAVIFTPSGGAGVRPPGGALSDAAITIPTDDSGQARCDLQLGDADGVYTATATLDPALEQDDSLPVVFRSVAETNIEHDRLPMVDSINWTNDSPMLLTTLNAGLEVR